MTSEGGFSFLTRVTVYWFLSVMPVAFANVPICLTWNTTRSYLSIHCTVWNATYDINILDPFDNNRVHCISKHSPGCSVSRDQDLIFENNSENVKKITLHTNKYGAEGKWKCRHGDNETIAPVMYGEGRGSPNDIGISGEVTIIMDRHMFRLHCFSCFEPDEKSVDFIINGDLKDSVRYYNGFCYHKRNLCSPTKCSCLCEGTYFIWNFKSELTYIHFTCVMRFNDKIHEASLIYNGSVLLATQHNNMSVTNSDNPAIDIDDDDTGNSELIKILVLTIVGVIIFGIFMICCCVLYKRNKKKASHNDRDKRIQNEDIPLIDQNVNNIVQKCSQSERDDELLSSIPNLSYIVFGQDNLNQFIFSKHARDYFRMFELEVLKVFGFEVEEDRVNLHLNTFRNARRHNQSCHGVIACLYRNKPFRLIRLYDDLNLDKHMHNEIIQIFKLIVDTKPKRCWYHYRRNGLGQKGSSERTLKLLRSLFLAMKPSDTFHQFNTYESRLKTFQMYPIEITEFRVRLAKAGFFYFNVSDYVQCFNCGGCLRTWNSMNEPMERHRMNFKSCPFILNSKKLNRSEPDTTYKIEDSLYTAEGRLNSFKSFSMKFAEDDLQLLIKAGFYYCGIAEDIACCECNIEFVCVQNVDYILSLHEMYSNDCPNIRNLSKRRNDDDQECIPKFVPYLELECIEHDFT